jgi:hypothetical protein
VALDLVAVREGGREPGGDLGHGHITWRSDLTDARVDLSLKDVAAAGGWKDTETLLRCYQHPDAETLLAAMEESRKLRDGTIPG